MASGAVVGSARRSGNRSSTLGRPTLSPAPGGKVRRSILGPEPSETTSLLGSDKASVVYSDEWHWPSRPEIHMALTEPQTPVAVTFFLLVVVAIVGSIAAFCLESMAAYEHWHGWKQFEVCIVALFTTEVGLRWWATPENNFTFWTDPFTLIDVVAIFPFYLDLLLPGSAVDLRWVRVLRLINLFKVGRHSAGLQFMFRAILRSIAGLALLAFLLFQALMVFSTIMWVIERGEWSKPLNCYARLDGKCSPFQSIAHAGWWGITTMTTVGYGDSIPITVPGRWSGAVAMLGGIIMLALPTTVFGSQFAEEYNAMKQEEACHRVLAENEDADEHEELLALRAELVGMKDQLVELLPSAHRKVESYIERQGRAYFFMRTAHSMRDAVSSMEDYCRLVEDWSHVPPTPSYGSVATPPSFRGASARSSALPSPGVETPHTPAGSQTPASSRDKKTDV